MAENQEQTPEYQPMAGQSPLEQDADQTQGDAATPPEYQPMAGQSPLEQDADQTQGDAATPPEYQPMAGQSPLEQDADQTQGDGATPPEYQPMAGQSPLEGALEDDLPSNQVNVEDAGTLKKRITVTVPRVRIDSKRDEMFGELSESAQVPGFRVGRAPRRLLEKRFGKEVDTDVRNSLLGESIGDAIEQSDLRTLGEPDIDLEAIEVPDAGDMEFSFEVEVFPEFELPPLEGIAVEKPKLEVTDERIDEHLRQIAESRAKFEPSDEPAEPGDMVVAAADIRGEEIEDVHRPGLTLRVGAGQIEGIPLVDLGKELTGSKAGDIVSMKVTVPGAHPNEDWQGKEVTVEVTLSEVRKRRVPEIDEETAESLGFDSLKELREYVGEQMSQRIESEAQQAMRRQIEDYLVENVEMEIPEGIANRHATRILQRRYVEMLRSGMPRERVDEQMTELQAQATEAARDQLKRQFVLTKIAEQRDLTVSEGEVNAAVAQMASMYGRRPERFRQELAADGTLEQLSDSMLQDKVLDQLLQSATVSEVDAGASSDEGDKPGEDDAGAEDAASRDE
jgi:trigger factor